MTTIRLTALAVCAATVMIGAGAPKQPMAILDLPYAPTPDGRIQFINVTVSVFAPLIALARPCGRRSQAWAGSLDKYMAILFSSPHANSGEAQPSREEIDYAKAAMRGAELEALLDMKRGNAGEACKAAFDPDNLREADGLVKQIMNRKPKDRGTESKQ